MGGRTAPHSSEVRFEVHDAVRVRDSAQTGTVMEVFIREDGIFCHVAHEGFAAWRMYGQRQLEPA